MNGYKVFSIPADGDEHAEKQVNQFLAQHKIINVEKQFVQNNCSFWSLCVHYRLPVVKEQNDYWKI